MQRRPRGVDVQQAAALPLSEVDADRGHVAQHLMGRLLVGEHQRPLAAPARGVDEAGADAALAGARRARDQRAAAAVEPGAAQHVVQPGDAGGHAFAGGPVIQAHRRDRQHRDAVPADQERIFVGAVLGAAVLHDPQAARGHLVDDAMVQQDHAVGHVLFEAIARQRLLAALAGDHRGDAAILEPAEQAAQFGAQHGVVGQSGEQGLDGVEHHTLRADGVDRMAEADEQAFEVVLARLLDLVALDVHVVDGDLLLLAQLVQVDAQRAQVLRQLLGVLLEHHEDARFAVVDGAMHQELGGQHRLAGAGGAADQGRTTERQAAFGDFVQALDAGARLGQRRRFGGTRLRGFDVARHVVPSGCLQ